MGHDGFFIYDEGNKVQELIHFQRYSLEDFYAGMKKNIGKIKKTFFKIIKPFARKALLKMSKPYQAIKDKNEEKIKEFFGKDLDNK